MRASLVQYIILAYLICFLAVAQERHFTRAAAKVGIGQPPLSQQIKDLEAEVGAALFHRLAHGAELTEAGKAFLAGVKEMPLIAQRATMAARRAARGELNPDLTSDMSKAEDEMLCRPVWHNHCIDEKTFAPISEVDELPLLLGSSETGMT